MSTKQVQMRFQIAATGNVEANVTVAFSGVEVFSGPLADTTDEIVFGNVMPDATPFSLVEFNYNVPDQTHYPEDPTAVLETTPVDVVITINGGNAAMQYTATNYNGTWGTGINGPIIRPGDAATFQELKPVTQPTWNGVPLTTRYNITANEGTGPGTLLILDGEVMEYQIQIPNYYA